MQDLPARGRELVEHCIDLVARGELEPSAVNLGEIARLAEICEMPGRGSLPHWLSSAQTRAQARAIRARSRRARERARGLRARGLLQVIDGGRRAATR